jgi:type IV secretion system protein VirB10
MTGPDLEQGDPRAMPDPGDRGGPGPDLAPRVVRPREIVPLPLAIAMAAVLALALFLFLNARRSANEATATSTAARARPALPPLLVPAPVVPVQPVVVAVPAVTPPTPPSARPPVIMAPPPPPPAPPVQAPRPLPPPPPPGSSQPALVVDLTAGSGAPVNGTGGAAATAAGEGDETVRATQIRHRASIIPQGAIIAAVLETPLNSDRPGLARAIVSQDVRGFDGTRVLIPRGSRLIGEFHADPNPGLRRILVTWNRLIRPDGVAIRIGSPVSDPLGGAGVAGRVNTHFFERFSSAVLQSALAIGVNLASQPSNGGVYISGAGQSVSQALAPTFSRPPTVKVREGAEIAVFVARDLDFGGTPPVR